MGQGSLRWGLPLLLMGGLLLRLPGLDSPLLDGHAWRQTHTATIARNYVRNGYVFWRPQVDWAGSKPGHVRSELPVYPYLLALVWGLTGVREWVGRLLTALLSLWGGVALYRLAERWFDERVALGAVFFYMVNPVHLFFHRVVMPDALMVSASLWALERMECYLERRHWSLWLQSWLLLAAAGGTKPTSLIVAVPMLARWLQHWGKTGWKRWEVWGAVGGLALLVGAWDAYALHWGRETPEGVNLLGTGALLNWRLWLDLGLHRTFWSRFLFVFAGLAGTLLALLGAGEVYRRRNNGLILWTLAGVAIYLFMPNYVMGNYYYFLPLLPPLGLLVALGWARFSKPALWPGVGVLLVGGFAVGYQVAASWYRWNQPVEEAARAVRERTAEGDLVFACCEDGPALLYYCQRRGWFHWEPGASPAQVLERRQQEGMRWFVSVLPEHRTGPVACWLREHGEEIVAEGTFILWKIRPAAGGSKIATRR